MLRFGNETVPGFKWLHILGKLFEADQGCVLLRMHKQSGVSAGFPAVNSAVLVRRLNLGSAVLSIAG
jgi:hypothetical protein